jgi:hypothetical protein
LQLITISMTICAILYKPCFNVIVKKIDHDFCYMCVSLKHLVDLGCPVSVTTEFQISLTFLLNAATLKSNVLNCLSQRDCLCYLIPWCNLEKWPENTKLCIWHYIFPENPSFKAFSIDVINNRWRHFNKNIRSNIINCR